MKNRQKRRKPARPLSSQQTAKLQEAIHAHSTGSLAIAEARYRALIAENIRSPELFCNLAAICAQTSRRDEADTLWQKALAIDPDFLEAQMNLADSCQQAGDIAGASSFYQQIITKRQDFHIARYLLANILKSQGRMEKAATHYQRIMADQPNYTQAHFSYSNIHKYRDRSDPHIDTMLELRGGMGLSGENKIHLDFALAKAFEDIGDYQQSFSHLESGNKLRFDEFHYDIQSDAALIDSIIQAFSSDAISGLKINAATSDRPIFIVGMPRSGTSLVEKILSSHSTVYGAGELDYMFGLGTSQFLGEANNFEFQPLNTYAQATFEKVGAAYLEKVRMLDDESQHVTDKMPFNMMMVGLIKIALPNAKIVHCVRDARDTCLSIYKQNFTTGNYRFAYDLKTVAQFHNLYSRLMRHWHDVIPDTIYDVNYESLTHNPEDEIRGLLAACGLEFEENCLSFDKTKAVVKTASAYQVRQPMYTSSVALWEKYGAVLDPMLEELQGS